MNAGEVRREQVFQVLLQWEVLEGHRLHRDEDVLGLAQLVEHGLQFSLEGAVEEGAFQFVEGDELALVEGFEATAVLK